MLYTLTVSPSFVIEYWIQSQYGDGHFIQIDINHNLKATSPSDASAQVRVDGSLLPRVRVCGGARGLVWVFFPLPTISPLQKKAEIPKETSRVHEHAHLPTPGNAAACGRVCASVCVGIFHSGFPFVNKVGEVDANRSASGLRGGTGRTSLVRFRMRDRRGGEGLLLGQGCGEEGDKPGALLSNYVYDTKLVI
jgi:hypothetical protein